MKYSTNDREITLKRGIAEWINEDCPEIRAIDEDGYKYRVFSTFFDGTYIDQYEKDLIINFIEKSNILYCKKYKQQIEPLYFLEEYKLSN